jgi:hypothetical protein
MGGGGAMGEGLFPDAVEIADFPETRGSRNGWHITDLMSMTMLSAPKIMSTIRTAVGMTMAAMGMARLTLMATITPIRTP